VKWKYSRKVSTDGRPRSYSSEPRLGPAKTPGYSSAHGRSDPDPDALDEVELFAKLEEEIENDDGPLREQGLKEVSKNYNASTKNCFFVNSLNSSLGWTRVFSGRRMEHLKQMREDMHGKYSVRESSPSYYVHQVVS
jgi:hypothetical protein